MASKGHGGRRKPPLLTSEASPCMAGNSPSVSVQSPPVGLLAFAKCESAPSDDLILPPLRCNGGLHSSADIGLKDMSVESVCQRGPQEFGPHLALPCQGARWTAARTRVPPWGTACQRRPERSHASVILKTSNRRFQEGIFGKGRGLWCEGTVNKATFIQGTGLKATEMFAVCCS